MYGLYDREGVLRFVNSGKEACLAYAELFELKATNYCLIYLTENINTKGYINLDLNQAKNNN